MFNSFSIFFNSVSILNNYHIFGVIVQYFLHYIFRTRDIFWQTGFFCTSPCSELDKWVLLVLLLKEVTSKEVRRAYFNVHIDELALRKIGRPLIMSAVAEYQRWVSWHQSTDIILLSSSRMALILLSLEHLISHKWHKGIR